MTRQGTKRWGRHAARVLLAGVLVAGLLAGLLVQAGCGPQGKGGGTGGGAL